MESPVGEARKAIEPRSPLRLGSSGPSLRGWDPVLMRTHETWSTKMAQTFTFIAETNHRKAGSLGAAFIDWLIANPKSDRNAIKAGGHDLKHLRWDLEHNAEKFLVEGEREVKVAAPKGPKQPKVGKVAAKIAEAREAGCTTAEAIADFAKLNIRTVESALKAEAPAEPIAEVVYFNPPVAEAEVETEVEADVEAEAEVDLLTSEDQFEVDVRRHDELSAKSVVELRKMASEFKIKNYGKLSKADLIAALI